MKARHTIAVGFILTLQLLVIGCTRSSLPATQTADCQGGIKVLTRSILHCVFNEMENEDEVPCPQLAVTPYSFRGALICSADDNLTSGELDQIYREAWPTERDDALDMMIGDAIRLVAYELDSGVPEIDSTSATDTN